MVLDIGPDSAQALADIIMNAKTILWNGPCGVFEFDNFAKGTEVVAQAIAQSDAFSVAGGGDTLAAIDKYGLADQVSYISTGGGAFLEFVEGKVLPAVITVYSDKSFDFVIKTPPAAVQIMEQAKIKKGSSEPNRSKVATISWDKVRTIAEDKLPDMNCFTVDSAMRMVVASVPAIAPCNKEPRL